MSYKLKNDLVKKFKSFEVSGNVIPSNWFYNLTTKDGKPYITAILILSEILYWYRPTINEDEEVEQKFRGDMLQKNHNEFMEKFNIKSKETVRKAIKYLKDQNLVNQQLRTIKKEDKTYYNSPYYEPIIENIKKVTYKKNNKKDSNKNKRKYPQEEGVGSPKRDTNKNNINKNINNNNKSKNKKDEKINMNKKATRKTYRKLFKQVFNRKPKLMNVGGIKSNKVFDIKNKKLKRIFEEYKTINEDQHDYMKIKDDKILNEIKRKLIPAAKEEKLEKVINNIIK